MLDPECPVKGHKEAIKFLEWSHDGKYLASSSHSHEIHILDATTLQQVADPLRGIMFAWAHTDTIFKGGCARFCVTADMSGISIYVVGNCSRKHMLVAEYKCALLSKRNIQMNKQN